MLTVVGKLKFTAFRLLDETNACVRLWRTPRRVYTRRRLILAAMTEVLGLSPRDSPRRIILGVTVPGQLEKLSAQKGYCLC